MKKCILIVDDSEIVRHQVRTALEAAAFDVVEAFDGIDGIAKLAANPAVELIICDLKMPRMDGLEMLHEVKSMPEHATLPVLMLTTEGHADVLMAAKRAGARGWIVKPFVPEGLVGAARKLTGATALGAAGPR